MASMAATLKSERDCKSSSKTSKRLIKLARYRQFTIIANVGCQTGSRNNLFYATAAFCNYGELPIPDEFYFIAIVSGVPENMGVAFGNSLLAHPRRHLLLLPVCLAAILDFRCRSKSFKVKVWSADLVDIQNI
jgi:hypothetical protein